MTYITLFFAAFISATLFPMGSEALLVLNITQEYNIFLLLFFATTGNVLGSCINYYLGLKGERYLEEKKYIKKEKIAKYKAFFDKYGGYSLLLSWVPLIGDPITFIAGVLKYKFRYFFILVLIAKLGRYTLLALGVVYFK
ncbi:MAG: YqaA family protein [Arcobacteraceae bacterium]